MENRNSLFRTLVSPGFWIEQIKRVGRGVVGIFERAKETLGTAKDAVWGFIVNTVRKIVPQPAAAPNLSEPSAAKVEKPQELPVKKSVEIAPEVASKPEPELTPVNEIPVQAQAIKKKQPAPVRKVYHAPVEDPKAKAFRSIDVAQKKWGCMSMVFPASLVHTQRTSR
ncbi:MAG: hypothetical protein FWD15_05920 [Alphaproteobacteria bacterium]|nr:hypothetical protein [Alphaproteobacteria bacterium]